jgi:catechol 2,3-dioxygenase
MAVRGRGVIDTEALNSDEMQALRNTGTATDLPFNITKIGHVVLKVSDVARAAEFYTKILGFRISDVYPDSMMPGKMVFMRCNPDHHGVALVGGKTTDADNSELDHIAFEVATIDEVLKARDHLRANGVQIDFEGRRRAGCQVAVEFRDPDNHRLEIFWGLDQLPGDTNSRPPDEWREAFSIEDAIIDAPPGQDTTLSDPKLR